MPLQVAIPDTTLTDCSDLREKTTKLGQIARALAVFRVEDVFVYSTTKLKAGDRRDVELIAKILSYMNTPQYLRKRVFPRSPSLRYAGTLPPLRTRSHPLKTDIHDGAYRWGLQIRQGQIDIGLNEPASFSKPVSEHEPTLFRIVKTEPPVKIEMARREDVPMYWGFKVIRTDNLLAALSETPHISIGFSKNAPPYGRIKSDIEKTVTGDIPVVAIFGGPAHGILDLFENKDAVKEHIDFWANTIPDQGTETVRLEEAILISLGMINTSLGHNLSKPGYHLQ
jgi:predicted SPOUT superfamily RNA methylase MTH1